MAPSPEPVGQSAEHLRFHRAPLHDKSGAQYCELSNNGACVTDGAGNYGTNERCIATALRPLTLSTTQWSIKFGDRLDVNVEVGGITLPQSFTYAGSGPSNVFMYAGSTIFWYSGTSTGAGFTVCGTALPPAPPVPPPESPPPPRPIVVNNLGADCWIGCSECRAPAWLLRTRRRALLSWACGITSRVRQRRKAVPAITAASRQRPYYPNGAATAAAAAARRAGAAKPPPPPSPTPPPPSPRPPAPPAPPPDVCCQNPAPGADQFFCRRDQNSREDCEWGLGGCVWSGHCFDDGTIKPSGYDNPSVVGAVSNAIGGMIGGIGGGGFFGIVVFGCIVWHLCCSKNAPANRAKRGAQMNRAQASIKKAASFSIPRPKAKSVAQPAAVQMSSVSVDLDIEKEPVKPTPAPAPAPAKTVTVNVQMPTPQAIVPPGMMMTPGGLMPAGGMMAQPGMMMQPGMMQPGMQPMMAQPMAQPAGGGGGGYQS